MQQAGKQYLRQILQNPETGRTILVEGSDEDITYKKDVVTGGQLECLMGFPLKWKEPGSGEELILYGIEITDGFSSKVYAPTPQFFFRLRFASGRALFALSGDRMFLDALTQSPIKLEESCTIEGFSPSTGRFSGAASVGIIDEDEEDEDEEDYREKPSVLASSPSARTTTPRQQEPARYQPQGGKWRLGKDIQTGQYVDVPQASRRQGLYIIGATGTGKSGLIENLIIQDIKQGLGVGLLDPHGDLTDAVLSRLPDTRFVDGVKHVTEEDVILLDIKNTQYPFGLNLFSCPDPSDLVALTTASAHVMHIFRKLWGKGGVMVDDAWGVLLEKVLENATLTLLENPGYTMAEIPLLLDVDNPTFRKKLVQNLMGDAVRDFWEREFATLSARDQREEIQSTLTRVNSFLRQQLVRNIIGQSRTTIDFRSIMDERKILLVRLSVRLGEGITTLLGTMIIAGILDAAYSRADLPVNKRKQFNLYADEFQRFASEDFATLLTEARKYGIATTIAHQMRSQLDTQNRGATLNVANLVVFKISGADATEIAGEFDITPQEAWEEEIEKERVQVLRPQRHERIEEQVEVEVEEDIEEISQNPVSYLESARGTHGSIQVREATQAFLMPLTNLHTVSTYTVKWTCGSKDQVAADLQEGKTLLNTILVDVMGGHLKPGTREYVERIAEYCVFHANVFRSLIGVPFVDLPSGQYLRQCSNRPELRAPAATYCRCLSNLVSAMIADNENLEEIKQRLIEAVIDLDGAAFFALHNPDRSDSFYHYTKQLPSWHPEYIPDIDLRERWYPPPRHSPPPYHSTRQEDREAKEKAKQLGWQRFEWDKKKAEDEARKEVPEIVHRLIQALTRYIPYLVALCEGLAADPIKVPTGKKRMVKRIQPHITYLTHESEKITIPRKTIMHPQRTYADVLNEVASQIANLPAFTARVKIATEGKPIERTIRTLEPERGLGRTALLERIERIRAHNRDDGYVRLRQEVEAEIRQRQEQWREPPEPPPITRRPK